MNTTVVEHTIPPEFERLFKNPPVLTSENRLDYAALRTGLVGLIKPENLIEWLMLRELLELIWEERRYIKAKAAIVNMTWKEGLRMVLETILDGDIEERRVAAENHADAWHKSEEAENEIRELLLRHGLSEDSIMAQAMTLRMPELEAIERFLDGVRRNKKASLREIEQMRAALTWRSAKDLPRALDAVVVPQIAPGQAVNSP